MRRSWLADASRREALLRRLDEVAGWINPVLMTIAAMLLIANLSCYAALILSRLPITHIQDLPPAGAEGVSVRAPFPPS